jgi:hypothetical protein
VTDASEAAWTGDEAELAASARLAELEERLVLIDRIAGLESELAELTGLAVHTPTEQLTAEQQVVAMRSSIAWRVGRAVTSPQSVLRRLRRS